MPLHRRYPANTMIGTQSDEQLIKTISNPLQHTDSKKFSTEISTSKDVATAALAVTLWYLGNQSAQRDIAERFDISPGHRKCHCKGRGRFPVLFVGSGHPMAN